MLETRPIITITLGYIVGIIIGLYFNTSIVFFYVLIIVIYKLFRIIRKKKVDNRINKKIKLLSLKRYMRYLKIIFRRNVIILIIVSSILSNTIILYQNNKYDNTYNYEDDQEINFIGTIISNKNVKDTKDVYIIRIENLNGENKYKNTRLYLNVKSNLKIELEYGDKVKVRGKFMNPTSSRNYKGFSYKEYLKTLKIYGTVNLEKYTLLKKDSNNKISTIGNKIFLNIKKKIESVFEKNVSTIILGLMLGYIDDIDEDVIKDFSESNISYILAISGMHIIYITMFFNCVFTKTIGKRKSKIYTSIILLIYMFIAGFTPSVTRAGITAIITLMGFVLYRKSDVLNNISLSLLILLLYNPFLIKSISLLLSFVGTISIILLQKNVIKYFCILEERHKEKNKRKKKIIQISNSILKNLDKIKESIAITISAAIGILPIMMLVFNQMPLCSLCISVLISWIIGPVICICLICMISIYFRNIKFITDLTEISINFILNIANLGSNIKLNKVYVITPNCIEIIIYYIIVLIVNFLFNIYTTKKLHSSQIRVKNIISLLKYRFNQNKKQFISIFLVIIFIISIIYIIPKNMKVHFIDVGQGDSTLIITPKKQTILIDGGGSEFSTFDVGEKILLPYLLDRRIKKIDYIVISHFDNDHIRTVYLQSWKI